MSKIEKVKKLNEELEGIQLQIMEHEAVLKANSVGMNEPLTDAQDYPLANVDLYAVRNARGKIRCLQNDRKVKMAEIEQILADIHQKTTVDAGGEESREGDEKVHRTSNEPFLQVDRVVPDSPAQSAGLCDGDLVIQFGPIYADVFQKLEQLKELVEASQNKPIRLTVLRKVRVHHLQLIPQNWTGTGLVGCSFMVVEKKVKK